MPDYNNNQQQKIYCGSGKEFGQYGTVNISICLDDLPSDYITTSQKNGKRYVNLKLNRKREVDQWGKTHSLEVDTWLPNQQNGQNQSYQQAPQATQNQSYQQPQNGQSQQDNGWQQAPSMDAGFDNDLPF